MQALGEFLHAQILVTIVIDTAETSAQSQNTCNNINSRSCDDIKVVQLLPEAPLAKHKWRNFSRESSTRPEAKARRLLLIKSVSWRDIAETGRLAISGGERKKKLSSN